MDATAYAVHPAAERDRPSRVPGLNVLIAEDNVDGANLMAQVLDDAGHNVRVLYDGQDALTAAMKLVTYPSTAAFGSAIIATIPSVRLVLSPERAETFCPSTSGR